MEVEVKVEVDASCLGDQSFVHFLQSGQRVEVRLEVGLTVVEYSLVVLVRYVT